MKQLYIHRDGWLEGRLEDGDEARTFARVRISVGTVILTRNLSARDGGDSDAVNVPLLPLAQTLASVWWPLLYEPFRSGAGAAFKARHRLDVPMHGYAFPKVALCSGGNDTLLTAWAQSPEEHARIEFLAPASTSPEILARDQAEEVLMDVIETVLARLDSTRAAYEGLAAAWDRVRTSIGDRDELAYCRAAGRLGLDPYDPSGPDLTEFTSDISETIFEDISDAAFIEELFETTEWVRDANRIWRDAPRIEVAAFGDFPRDQLDLAAWEMGGQAAEALRQNTGCDLHRPRKHLEQLFGEILLANSASFRKSPPSVSALVARESSIARIATVARSAREQRFKACAAAYIAWGAIPGEDRATTPAFTRRQQASRAFAAELLAPREYLRGRAPPHGFTSDQIQDMAGELICPFETVVWQAHHAGIPLRGVGLPAPEHPAIV
jgi:hypothetical protein